MVSTRDLVRNALRMRPDRIVVGGVSDSAALDMLQAMNTGHDGSLTPLHANTPRDALSRLETMVLMAGMDLPSRAIRDQIASAVDLIIQIPPDQRERVFEMFAMVDPASREGHGIGLSTCHRIIDRHGGAITIGDKPGGTTIRVLLPASSA
jgi:Flp pilus assembly CpaF family ATPase